MTYDFASSLPTNRSNTSPLLVLTIVIRLCDHPTNAVSSITEVYSGEEGMESGRGEFMVTDLAKESVDCISRNLIDSNTTLLKQSGLTNSLQTARYTCQHTA